MRIEAVPTPSGAGVTIQNRLTGPEGGSDKLMVMLPGNNYSCDAPALFYLRQAAVAAGWDVLSTAYAFQQTGGEVDGPAILADVRAAVERVLPNGYREICIAAKSLGSAVALPLARTLSEYPVSLLILTPVPQFLQEPVGDLRTLVVIGTEDPVYQMPECAAARERADAEWVVVPDLDHGFNVKGDWERSVASLPQVIAPCLRFLAGS
ncbi:pimeloyl-ACP methyl ester carboxylesterase [Symbiobacterium terraclitae]|uniref:Pimeloyl-ACP methyl ester carboxylesterase n=1 Tax=Symbiobacterium terraclitae TaxID=557451 RepID=A0ABS4JSP0_9FIRM|nr:hypothetical protein [Symbiobacterium terraclitae]MBP2018569.1 pimeloyl-ACP methyl ester carboxylesterase [Symbiobacterium terraclitae]